MPDLFVIRMTDDDAPVDWLVVDDSGAARAQPGRGTLPEAAVQVAERPVLVVIDDVAVSRTHCQLPVSGRRLAQALPYALEEHFAGDVDTLHFAAGDADADGRRAVAALDNDIVDRVLSRLADAAIAPRGIYTWHDALAPLDGFVQLLAIDDRVLLCDASGTCAALQGLAPDEVLDAWRAARNPDAPELNVRVYADAAARTRAADVFDALVQREADIKQLPDGLLPFVARQIVARGGINLLQGAYAVRSDVGARLRPWSLAAALAGVAVILSLAAAAADLRRLQATSERLDADMLSLLQQVRPDAANTRNPESQLSALVDRGGRGGGTSGGAASDAAGAPFLPTLGALAGALGASGQDTTVDAISYRGGVFDVRLTTANAQTLEQLTSRVADTGALTAQIQRTEQADDRVRSFVQIRGVSEP